MTNRASDFSIQDKGEFYFKQALEIVANLPPDHLILPKPISLLEEAIAYGSAKALRLMVRIVLFKKSLLSKEEKLTYLKMGAQENRDAAYEVALALVGWGRFAYEGSREVDKAWRYFFHAAELNHPRAYFDMLTAICRNKMTLDANTFIESTRRIIAETQSYDIQLILGAFLCGKAPEYWNNLTTAIKLNDPDAANLGFKYLYALVISDGPADYRLNALSVIKDGFEEQLFNDEFALNAKHKFFKNTSTDEYIANSCTT